MLLYHGIGSGKTCWWIQICEKFKKQYNIYVCLPASLITNYYKEIFWECTGNEYIWDDERKTLNEINPFWKQYKKLIKNVIDRIKRVYKIFWFQKFCRIKK